MNNGIFITGTNTCVGKTLITRGITRALVNRGLEVTTLKPVESGAQMVDGTLLPDDATALMRASKTDGPLSKVCAYMLEDPVSPHLAAATAGVTIRAEKIVTLIEAGSNASNITLVEGAGGFLVPLSDDTLYADVVERLGLGVIIVAPNVLGTINATLLTIEAARSRSIPIHGVILNRTPERDYGNAEAIVRHGCVPLLGEFSDVEYGADDDALASMAEATLDMDRIASIAKI